MVLYRPHHPRLSCWIVAMLAIVVYGADSGYAQRKAPETVTLQLKWNHQFQFADLAVIPLELEANFARALARQIANIVER